MKSGAQKIDKDVRKCSKYRNCETIVVGTIYEHFPITHCPWSGHVSLSWRLKIL
jgi:hypothetical protein